MILIFSSTGLSACRHSTDDDTYNVVCSIFPLYDWTINITADTSTNVIPLIDNGTDMHSFQPSAKDIATILTADLVIYIGGESEEWIDDLLSEAANSAPPSIKLMSSLSDMIKEEEIKEGMEVDDEDELEYDEHIYLSIKNAKLCTAAILDKLCEMAPELENKYVLNQTKYIAQLSSLDKDYQTTIDKAANRTLIFGDRFPFRYLVDDYNLEYYAAFVGCSAETEASFKTIDFLSSKVDSLGIKYIIKLETSNGDIANAIKNNTSSKNQQILTLNSMQNTKTKDNKHYIQIMRENLTTLQTALS